MKATRTLKLLRGTRAQMEDSVLNNRRWSDGWPILLTDERTLIFWNDQDCKPEDVPLPIAAAIVVYRAHGLPLPPP